MFEGEDGLDTDKGTPSEGAFPNASVWGKNFHCVCRTLFQLHPELISWP